MHGNFNGDQAGGNVQQARPGAMRAGCAVNNTGQNSRHSRSATLLFCVIYRKGLWPTL